MGAFIRKRWYIPLVIVGIIGFAAGFFLRGRIAEKAKADGDVKKGVLESGGDFEEIFLEKLYTCMQHNDGTCYVKMRKNADMLLPSDSDLYLYTGEDADALNKKILGTGCELTVVTDDGVVLIYEEYQNGYPTGAIASYLINDDGLISEAFYRKGKIYDFDGPIIPYEEAYELALKAIPDKYNVENYGFEIDLYESSAESCDYRIYYNPEQEKLCYMIGGFGGVVTGDTTLAGIEVWFDVILAVDGSSVEVASTLTF